MGLKICISNKFAAEADAAGLRDHIWRTTAIDSVGFFFPQGIWQLINFLQCTGYLVVFLNSCWNLAKMLCFILMEPSFLGSVSDRFCTCLNAQQIFERPGSGRTVSCCVALSCLLPCLLLARWQWCFLILVTAPPCPRTLQTTLCWQ